MLINLSQITKQYGSKVLFENTSARIDTRSRMALIGPNGSGKSTLIRMILGEEAVDAGKIVRAQGLTIGHLPQDLPARGDDAASRTVLQEVLRMDGRRAEVIALKNDLEQQLSEMDYSDEDRANEVLERYTRVVEELEHLDEYRIEARAQEILMGMGFKITDFSRRLTEFSGGWLMRIALARVLLLDPDLLVLDEPTNHLDLESLLWLEDFLKNHAGALLLVSHDTEFVNRLVNEVLELDQEKFFLYRGNLDSYVTQKEERLTLMRSQYANQQDRIAQLESFVKRFGAKASKARQAQSRVKLIEKIKNESTVVIPDERDTVGFRFPPAPHSGKEVVTAQKMSFSYDAKTIFRNLDWIIPRGSRVGVVGPNGVGKTTLLRILAGAMEPTQGALRHGHLVKVGYYSQFQAESLDYKKSILQELEATAPEMPIARVRGVAGAFLFSGDAVAKKCGVLSGGEKARVALAKLLLSPSNFLILDEPTNHLDVESRGVLLEALQNYDGTLCMVSHDRTFMSSLVDTVLLVEPAPEADPNRGSQVTLTVGSYDEYLMKLEASLRDKKKASLSGLSSKKPGNNKDANTKSETPTKPRSETSAASTTEGPSNNQKRAWTQEREKREKEIAKLEAQLALLSEALSDTAVYEDKPKLMALMEDQRKTQGAIQTALSRWEELSGLLGD